MRSGNLGPAHALEFAVDTNVPLSAPEFVTKPDGIVAESSVLFEVKLPATTVEQSPGQVSASCPPLSFSLSPPPPPPPSRPALWFWALGYVIVALALACWSRSQR
jgi:hypothetical protein